MNLIESIRNEPEKWRAKEHYLEHECGAKLWTANGSSFCNPYNGGHFGFFMRMRAWRAYKWWTENAPIELLGRRD